MVKTSAGRFGREENDSIRFDEIVYCLFAFAFASPYGFVNNGYANSVFVSIFVVHINEMLNAGYLYKNFSNVVYQKYVIK